MSDWHKIFRRKPQREQLPTPPKELGEIEIEQRAAWLRRALSYNNPKYPNTDFYERLVIMVRQNDELMQSMEKGFVSQPMAEKITAAAMLKFARGYSQDGGAQVDGYIVDKNTVDNSHSGDLYRFAWHYVAKEIEIAIAGGTEQYKSTPSLER